MESLTCEILGTHFSADALALSSKKKILNLLFSKFSSNSYMESILQHKSSWHSITLDEELVSIALINLRFNDMLHLISLLIMLHLFRVSMLSVVELQLFSCLLVTVLGAFQYFDLIIGSTMNLIERICRERYIWFWSLDYCASFHNSLLFLDWGQSLKMSCEDLLPCFILDWRV